MKVIFLDIDGVLNNVGSKSRCCGYIGIDNNKVKLLRHIIESTGAQIILSSSWREKWYPVDKSACDKMAKYMDKKLAKEGLYILDKTDNFHGMRGREIHDFLDKHPEIDKWIVLDDVVFNDFEEFGILEHLVNTEYYSSVGGLTEKHVELAIKILTDDFDPNTQKYGDL